MSASASSSAPPAAAPAAAASARDSGDVSPAAVSRQNSIAAQQRHIAHQEQVASELQAHAREQQLIVEGHRAQVQRLAQEELEADRELERQSRAAASCQRDTALEQAELQSHLQALTAQQQRMEAQAGDRAALLRKQRDFERDHRDMSYRSTGSPTDRLLLEAAVHGKTRGQRVQVKIMAVCALVFVPWALFALLFAWATFWRYGNPGLYMAALVLALAGTAVLGMVDVLIQKQRQSALLPEKRGPKISSRAILCVLLLVAVAASYLFGNINYHLNMEPLHEMEMLKAYSGLDPSRTDGKQVMDAGQVHFVHAAKLELEKSVGLRNTITYCVAPIVSGNASSYDFWAVGVDCCSNKPGSFKCGEWENENAHAGLRLTDNNKREMYQLAVQSSAAALKIDVKYPLFFEWVEDPGEYMKTWKQDAQTYYIFGIFTFFGFNLLLALASMISTWAVQK